MSSDGVRRSVDLNALRAAAQTSAIPQVAPPPAPVPRTRRDGPLPSLALARAPFVLMLSASIICTVIRFVPEIAFAPEVFRTIRSQSQVIAWVPGEDGFLGFCMFVALALTAVVARRRLVDDLVWIASGIIALIIVGSAITALVRDGLQASGLGIALAACLLVLLWQASRKLANAQPDATPPRFPTGVVVAMIATFLPSLALGRAVFGRAIVDVVDAWDPNAWTFANISTLWLWLAGAAVVILIGLAVSLVPPSQSSHRVAKVVTTILVIAVLAIYLAPTATSSARDEAQSLQNDDVSVRLTNYCSLWTRTNDVGPSTVLVFSGSGCSTIGVYSASILTASETVSYDLGQGSRFNAGAEMPPVVSAMYGDIVAIAAVAPDGTPGVIGVDFLSGWLSWEVMCPTGTQTPGIRFAGTKNEDPAVLRQTLPGEGEGIFLICDGTAQVLPPRP